MGKKVIVLILVLITSSLWGKYPFSELLNTEKIIELSENTDLLIEGEIVNKEYIYINRKTKEVVDLNQITEDSLSKIIVITNFEVKVIENFKNKKKKDNINVWILGGKLILKRKKGF